jgi:PBP1b-binding outer membrane lipoprotein LpoB
MMNKKIFLTMSIALLITGCQGTTDNIDKNVENPTTKPLNKQYEDHGLPVSNGPQNPPESMKGPDTPPPQNENAAKVITTDEKIRLTLPIKTE